MRTSRRRDSPSARAFALALGLTVAAHQGVGAEEPRDGSCDPGAVQLGPPADVLTLREAACFLRVEPSELERLVLQGSIPARQVGTQLRFSRPALESWLAGVDPSEPAETVEDTEPIGEAPEEDRRRVAFLRAQNVLLNPGEMTLEPALVYARSDGNTLAVSGPGAGLGDVERNTTTALLIARYGLLEETEVFFTASYFHDRVSVFLDGQKIAREERDEFGDIGLGLRRTVLREGPGLPDVILSVNGRFPTGDSSYAVGGGVAFVKSVDPVVLYASANYLHTFSSDFDDISLLRAENRVDATIGYGLALNDTLTLSTALTGLFTDRTHFDDATLRRRERYFLQLGLTALLPKDLFIEPTVSFGLNDPGNTVVFGLSMPFTFTPWPR